MRLKFYVIGAVIVGVLITAIVSFPVFVFYSSGRFLPAAWSNAVLAGDIGEIEGALGAPYEKFDEKSYEKWRIVEWWGYRELEIEALNFNKKDNFPDHVIYTVHVNGYRGNSDVCVVYLRGRSAGKFHKYFLIPKVNLVTY